jgi:hydroxymethylglutaryl-CoA lyase
MILISEVGPRDGLQSIDRVMPTEAKKAWIAAEAAAGVTEIEVGSFVPPSLLPQMADTAEVVAFARTIPGLNVVALVPNAKGAARAVEAGVHFAVGLSTAFGCTIEGPVSEDQVVRLAEASAEAGAQEFSLSDTTGYANPAQVKRLVKKVRAAVGEKLTTLHLHNTRGLGLANALAGLEEGITTLDASLGGLGGCPFAPGASGNIVTEDLVFMLHAMGIKTGINLPKLLKVRDIVAAALPGEPLYGFTPDAGLPLGFAA